MIAVTSAGGERNDMDARLLRVLESVPDPEIPVLSIVDLGIVRRAVLSPENLVEITPTYTGCPATLVIERAIREALDAEGFAHVRIRAVLAPPWTTDWISDEGRQKLLAYGIAPPLRGGGAAAQRGAPVCPQCSSSACEEVSAFGSTPCKALWRCTTCAEPFEFFKCH